MKFQNEIDPELFNKLELLEKTTERDPVRYEAGRAKFLQHTAEQSLPVTTSKKIRHKEWKSNLGSGFLVQKKEGNPLMVKFISLIVVLGLLIGSGTAIVSAQNSQPEMALYPIKLWTEDMRLSLTSDPIKRIDLFLRYADDRLEEMNAMLSEGHFPPEEVPLRYMNQMSYAIQTAASLQNEEGVVSLSQIRVRLQAQETLMQQINRNDDPNGTGLRAFLTQTIRERIRVIENELTSPGQIQQKLQFGQDKPGEEPIELTEEPVEPTESSGNGFSDKDDRQPAEGNQKQHQNQTPDQYQYYGTPQPNNSFNGFYRWP